MLPAVADPSKSFTCVKHKNRCKTRTWTDSKFMVCYLKSDPPWHQIGPPHRGMDVRFSVRFRFSFFFWIFWFYRYRNHSVIYEIRFGFCLVISVLGPDNNYKNRLIFNKLSVPICFRFGSGFSVSFRYSGVQKLSFLGF